MIGIQVSLRSTVEAADIALRVTMNEVPRLVFWPGGSGDTQEHEYIILSLSTANVIRNLFLTLTTCIPAVV